jgi:hypothetical protein
VVARDEEDLALEEVVQEGEHLAAERGLLLLVVGLSRVVAVDDVAPHETVVEVQRVAAHVLGQFL